jgi:hypothetical protein
MTPEQKYDLLKLLIQVGLPMIGVLVAGFVGAIVGALWAKYLTYVEKTEDFRINYINPLSLSVRESGITIARTQKAVQNPEVSEEVRNKIKESKEILSLTIPSLAELRKNVLAFIHNGFSVDMSTGSFYISVFSLYFDIRAYNSSMTKPSLSHAALISMKEQIDSIAKELENIEFETESFLSFLLKQLKFSLKFRGKGKKSEEVTRKDGSEKNKRKRGQVSF